MNDRDYLRSLGFTVGERGRFSAEMKEALAKRNGDVADTKIDGVRKILHLDKEVEVRKPRQLFGRTAEGYKVGFIICKSCLKHMSFCKCDDGVHAPKIIVSSDDPLVVLSSKL
jgi:hypothetical protein